MSRKEQCVTTVVAGIVGIGLFLYFVPSPYERYYSQFTRAKLLGLTEEQVLARVGQPHSILKEDGVWTFQIGKDPGAALGFTDGKVTEVWEWEK